MRIAIVTFGPFGDRGVNGSSTVGPVLAALIGEKAEHFILPVRWTDLPGIVEQLQGFDAIIGMGEGFDHFISVEQMAVRSAKGKDIDGELPPDGILPAGPVVLNSSIVWRHGWDMRDVLAPLKLPWGSPGVGENGYDGEWLCNGLHYLLLHHFRDALSGRTGFIHLPPQKGWVNRTGGSADEYGKVFARAVALVLHKNNWLIADGDLFPDS